MNNISCLPSPLSNTTSGDDDPDVIIRRARAFAYPKQVIALIATFIGVIVLSRFLSLLYIFTIRYQRKRGINLRRLPLAVYDVVRVLAFRCTVPIGSSWSLNLAEIFLTMAYIGILFTWALINTTTTTGVKFEPHYWANRAGLIAASQLPMMTALGTRNNIIAWLTGVSFDRLNYLHRTSARVMLVLFWVHGAGHLTIGLDGDDDLRQNWVRCGLLAASTLFLLCVTTIRPIRSRSYQVFIFIHAVLAFVFIMAAYFHTRGSQISYFGVWPAMIIWGVDRIMRILRILIYNFRTLNRSVSRNIDASVEVLSPRFLRVTLTRPSFFHWRPGQSAYLSFPEVSSNPFEAHPFTISTIDEEIHGGDYVKYSKLVFFLRVRDGLTRRLMNKGEVEKSQKAFFEGPYSSPPRLDGYHTVILIAGGSGVSFTTPLLLDLIRKAKESENAECERILFVWAIRSAEHLLWIADDLRRVLKRLPRSLSVELQIFVTQTFKQFLHLRNSSEDDPELKTKDLGIDIDPRLSDIPFAQIQQGRPDVKSLIKNEVRHATGPVSVNVCGIHGLVEATRKAVGIPRPVQILRGGPTIDLHVEAFGSV